MIGLSRAAERLELRGQATSASCDPDMSLKFEASVWSEPLFRVAASNCDNTAWLRAQLRKIRWFDIPTRGADADDAAWHLVQHADREPAFQRTVFERLRALPAAATSQKNLAYLWDRVARADGHSQRYGTQGFCLPGGSGQPHPIVDAERVDERRSAARMKLPDATIAENRATCPQPK